MIKNIIILGFALLSYQIKAEDVLIKALEMRNGAFIIKTKGEVNSNPNLTIQDKVVEVIIPNAHINSTIEKKINQATIIASQFDRSSVKVIATFGQSLKGKEGLVNITLKDNAIEINLPKNINKTVAVVSPNISRSPEIVTTPEADAKDEADLRKLENEQQGNTASLDSKKSNEAESKEDQKELFITGKNTVNKGTQTDTDRVNVAQASVAKSASASAKPAFSIATYVGKFVAFLSLMILGFYGVLTLFKKGVIKKGRLGFLHSTKLVEVLSTTHVAPKRSLMMIKAHKQVFLIANSETGMQLISEISDVTGLIKTGELELTGSNFESNLDEADKTSIEFKLKEVATNNKESGDFSLDDLLNETPAAAKSIAKAPVKDEVRLSDQIKTKLKNLKQLQ